MICVQGGAVFTDNFYLHSALVVLDKERSNVCCCVQLGMAVTQITSWLYTLHLLYRPLLKIIVTTMQTTFSDILILGTWLSSLLLSPFSELLILLSLKSLLLSSTVTLPHFVTGLSDHSTLETQNIFRSLPPQGNQKLFRWFQPPTWMAILPDEIQEQIQTEHAAVQQNKTVC